MTAGHYHGSHVAEPAPVSASERMRWLRRTAKRWILVVVILVGLCLAGTSWSFGLFTDSTTNPQNVVSAGTMSQDNTADNTAIMSTAGMVPGEHVEGNATIRNVGGAQGDFTLRVTDVQDVPGPNGGALSNRLRVKVFENDGDRPIYNGPITGLSLPLGTWQPNEERTYRLVVRFPKAGDSVDNKHQQSTVTTTFKWDAVQTH